MKDRERTEILHLLTEGADALRASVAGIGESEASRTPGNGQWSVLDCLEHVAVTERALFAGVRKATLADTPQYNPERETKIRNRALDRTRFIAAPEVVAPSGSVQTVGGALAQFEIARAETIRFVEEFEGDPRAWLTTHPLVRSPVNCWEMLLMIALHPKRHAEQIVHIRERTD